MKILLAGCTGFIGQNLVRHLALHGHECIVLIRSHRSTYPGYFPPGARLTPYDVRPESVDAVINLAGEPVAGGWTKQKKDRILDSRIDGTKELVDWMGTLATPPKVFLSASAVGFYGDRGQEIITEKTGPDPARRFLSQVCILWEQEANAARKYGIRVVNLRLGNVLDPAGGFLEAMNLLLSISPVYMPVAPEAYFPWISLKDAIEIISFSLTHVAVKGPINVVSFMPITGIDFYRALGAARKRRVFGHVPRWIIRAALGEFSEAVLGSQKILADKLVHAGYHFKDPDLTKFLVQRYGEAKRATRLANGRRAKAVKKVKRNK